ncbi:MAG: YdcF family protein [Candidatus Magasanikbacteria bacterium]|nr:YdcF family protein [Candidatus Magasanikbacteria bacterium]
MYQKIKKIILWVAGLCVFVFLALLIFANILILRWPRLVVSVADAPEAPVALVFGGGMKDVTTMSDIQTDRVKVGIELYKLGEVKKIMMTGDDGAYVSDEVDAMKKAALDAGVPAGDILVDPHGYRTYESCYREHFVYGLTSVIAISQNFHLARISYLCNHFGIQTVDVAADLRDYGFVKYQMNIRELGARLKAWWQIVVTKPQPMSLEK